MKTYLQIIRALIVGIIPIINATAQCSLPPAGRCVANWTMSSCNTPASSNIYAYDYVIGTSINNTANQSVIITSNLVQINGTSTLRPGAKLVGATVPCTIQSKSLFYTMNAVCSIGQITASSDVNLPDMFPIAITASCIDGTHDPCPTTFGTWKSTVGGVSLSNTDGTYITGNCGSGIANQVQVSTSYTNATFHTIVCNNFCQSVFNNSRTYFTNNGVNWPKLQFLISSTAFNCAGGGCAGVSVTPNSGLRIGQETDVYSGLTVFPNPNDGTFTVNFPSSEAYEVQISDMLGNVVLKESVSNTLVKNYALSNLSNGIYIVNLSGAGTHKKSKIQVMR